MVKEGGQLREHHNCPNKPEGQAERGGSLGSQDLMTQQGGCQAEETGRLGETKGGAPGFQGHKKAPLVLFIHPVFPGKCFGEAAQEKSAAEKQEQGARLSPGT